MAVTSARMALGTVQFGLPYGARAPSRPVDSAEIAAILTRSAAAGIDLLDTAPAYGDAEARLAAAWPSGVSFSIVTKLPRVCLDGTAGAAEVDAAVAILRASWETLGRRKFAAILVHHADDLLTAHGERVWDALEQLKEDGIASAVGVSVYDPATLAQVRARFPIRTVQLPLNLFDQRFAAPGLLAELAASGIAVHVRSAFLQGVLLQPAEALRPSLAALAPKLAALRAAAKTAGLPPAALALGFLRRVPGIERVVVGVDSLADLVGVLAAWDSAGAATAFPDCSLLAVDDAALTDPRRWT